MHAPTCPVKMPRTLQRPSANCHYVLAALSSGFGFSRSSKGISQHYACSSLAVRVRRARCTRAIRLRFKDMPTRLSFSSLLVPVRQIASRPSPSTLARYSAAVVFLPLKPTAADWAALPHGSVVRDLYARRVHKEGDSLRLSVGARAETLLIVACAADQTSTFERLQTAGKLARVLT